MVSEKKAFFYGCQRRVYDDKNDGNFHHFAKFRKLIKISIWKFQENVIFFISEYQIKKKNVLNFSYFLQKKTDNDDTKNRRKKPTLFFL